MKVMPMLLGEALASMKARVPALDQDFAALLRRDGGGDDAVSADGAAQVVERAPPSVGAPAVRTAGQAKSSAAASMDTPSIVLFASALAKTPTPATRTAALPGGGNTTPSDVAHLGDPDRSGVPDDAMSQSPSATGDLTAPVDMAPTTHPANLKAAPTRAFRFDELGMFGGSSGGVVAMSVRGAPATAPKVQVGANSLVTPTGSVGAGRTSVAQAITALAGVDAAAAAGIAAGELPDLDHGEASTGQLEPVNDVEAPAQLAARTDTEWGAASSPKEASDSASPSITPKLPDTARLRVDRADTPLNLLLTETSGSIQIVAVAPDLEPDAVDRLRRLTDETAAQFGKKIQGLHLNGSAVLTASAMTGAQT